MGLYVTGLVIYMAGLFIGSDEQASSYKKTWALILIICGALFIVIRFLCDAWSFE